MRADRLVSILLLLQAHGRMTAKQLAERLEVSKRTIYRDMEALGGAGIPVVAEPGASGGWRLLEDYRTNLTGLKESELRALLISPSTQLLADLGLTGTAEDARNKLLASLPATYKGSAHDVRQRIYIDTTSWRQCPEKLASFETVQAAIWEERKLQIKYRRPEGDEVDRVIEPLGLVAKRSVWYVVALAEGGLRTYRASRIQSAMLTDERFTRPRNFDLEQYWKESTKAFIDSLPAFEVRAEAAPSIFPRIQYAGRFVKIRELGSAGEGGWIPVTFQFDTEQEACEYVLGFGDQIRVIEPRNLIDQVVDMAEAVMKFYKQKGTKEGG